MKTALWTTILAMGFFIGFSTLANTVFDNPRYILNGVPHFIIYEDVLDDDWYDSSAQGFCTLQGFSTVYQTSAVLSGEGPYVALTETGEIIKTFPGKGNFQRFYEFIQIICK